MNKDVKKKIKELKESNRRLNKEKIKNKIIEDDSIQALKEPDSKKTEDRPLWLREVGKELGDPKYFVNKFLYDKLLAVVATILTLLGISNLYDKFTNPVISWIRGLGNSIASSSSLKESFHMIFTATVPLFYIIIPSILLMFLLYIFMNSIFIFINQIVTILDNKLYNTLKDNVNKAITFDFIIIIFSVVFGIVPIMLNTKLGIFIESINTNVLKTFSVVMLVIFIWLLHVSIVINYDKIFRDILIVTNKTAKFVNNIVYGLVLLFIILSCATIIISDSNIFQIYCVVSMLIGCITIFVIWIPLLSLMSTGIDTSKVPLRCIVWKTLQILLMFFIGVVILIAMLVGVFSIINDISLVSL